MRYSTRALPAYRFVPGDAPHPTRDPEGHSFGKGVPASRSWRPEDWRELEEWLWAVDLFNAEYWWESHEALETLWHAAGRTTTSARFAQALVHLSAACLNRRRGHLAAAQRQAARAVRGLRAARALRGLSAAGSSRAFVMGIDVERLIGDIQRSFASDAAEPVRIELDFEEA
jgi:hypothetical protein